MVERNGTGKTFIKMTTIKVCDTMKVHLKLDTAELYYEADKVELNNNGVLVINPFDSPFYNWHEVMLVEIDGKVVYKGDNGGE